jgi:flavin reductase (DIM6/NTAB) family NADH-FMN oxidoreductase RutF
MDRDFRDAMSLVPSSVSIIASLDDSKITACTISSLVSVSIDAANPEILFVLKKGSFTGSSIKGNKIFSLNVLASNQKIYADSFSKTRDFDHEFDSKNWRMSPGRTVELIGSRVFMACELIQVYEDHLADIYIAKVLDFKFDNAKPALIYDERKYGTLIPISNIIESKVKFEQ